MPDSLGNEGWASKELMLRASWYYYKDEMTQEEIARRLSVSRASVGRLLDRARRLGLVTISINAPHLASLELATQLCTEYGLTDALVVPDTGQALNQRAVNARVGTGGAQYLSSHLRPGVSLGVGWGDTVARAIGAADVAAVSPLHLVTLTGGVDGYLQALALSRGEPSGGQADELTASVIPSPIVVSNPDLAAALTAEPTIQDVLQLARSLQHALVGIGTATADATLVRMGYLSAADARLFTEKGAVGDILGQFYAADGEVLDLPIHARRIGLDLDDLRRIGKVVAVAGGTSKVEAIRGALRGRYIDVLVTNEEVARLLVSPG